MRSPKALLLTATVLSGFASAPAAASPYVALPLGTEIVLGSNVDVATHTVSVVTNAHQTTLHTAGAASVKNVMARAFNCIGPDNQLGNSSSPTALSTVSPGNYIGNGSYSTFNPSLDCSNEANNLQPNIQGQYVAADPDFARQMWAEFADNFDGAASGGANHVAAGMFNPFDPGHAWGHLHFAMSDSGLTNTDLDTYNATGNAADHAGPAITFPLYVVPVAIAYAPIYGTNAAGNAMVFNARGKGMNNTFALVLTKSVYCGIFNGTITNWNDPAIQLSNGTKRVAVRHGTGNTAKVNYENLGVPLFDPTNDNAARWAADGVPIRLVGQLDRSGTTDVFTRHLAAVCNSTNGFTANNTYLHHAQSLPYSAFGSGNADFRSVLAATDYNPSAASSLFAGTVNMVSGDYWNGTAIVNIGSGTPSSMPNGNHGSGLYLLASGPAKVASVLTANPDYTLHGVKLNGKVGYLSADFIQPSVDAPGGLNAALLQSGAGAFPQITYSAGNIYNRTDTKFALPTARAALYALTQSAPSPTDTRIVPLPTGGTGPARPENPLAWTEVLYADTTNTLANPQATGSYPLVGTTQFLGYTCYATTASREAVVNHLGSVLGLIKRDAAGNLFAGQTFGGSTLSLVYPSIPAQSNIGVVSPAWAQAIRTYFLSNAATNGLYIQDAPMPIYDTITLLPALDANNPAITGVGIKTHTNPNPVCSTVTGGGA